MSGTARSICVNGSVDGVSTAAATTEPTTTYRHTESICFEETKPVLSEQKLDDGHLERKSRAEQEH